MNICEFCGKEHDGTYGSGRFCSASCARQFSNKFVTSEGRERQIKALVDPENMEKSKKARIERPAKEKRQSLEYEQKMDHLSTMALGKLGEMVTTKKFIEMGIPVYQPVVDNGVVIVADFGGKLQKIQVKSTASSTPEYSYFCLESCGTVYNKGTPKIYKNSYSSDKVDYFSLYDANKDEVYLVKNTEENKNITLRHIEVNNGQKKKIHYSDEYKLEDVVNKIEMETRKPDIIYTEPIVFFDDEE